MLNFIRNFLKLFFFIAIVHTHLHAENIYFIDFTKVLNQSKAGADAQEKLKKKFIEENTKFSKEEKIIKDKEADLISQKKSISSEEYQKKINELRKQVSNLQANKQESLNSIAKSRNEAKQELISSVRPIIKKYMEDNNIQIVLDKESVILGETSFELTDKIIEILNQKLSSIKIN